MNYVWPKCSRHNIGGWLMNGSFLIGSCATLTPEDSWWNGGNVYCGSPRQEQKCSHEVARSWFQCLLWATGKRPNAVWASPIAEPCLNYFFYPVVGPTRLQISGFLAALGNPWTCQCPGVRNPWRRSGQSLSNSWRTGLIRLVGARCKIKATFEIGISVN